MEGVVLLIIAVFVIAIISYRKSMMPAEEIIEEKTIIGIGGIYDGVKITVGKEMYIGRNPEKCSVIYPEGTRGISSIHCCIRTLDGKIELTDMGSTCGTFLKNGEKLESNVPCLLEMGDVFYIAEQENSFLVK